MKKIMILSLVVLAAVACRKKKGEPKPRICTNKEFYKVNDTMTLENCSLNSTRQKWILPDGTTSLNPIIKYVVNQSGDFTFRLYVGNENFVQDYEAIHTVSVTP